MIYNGGNVTGLDWSSERNFLTRHQRHLLLQHRSKKYHHLVDRLILHCNELQELFNIIRANSGSHAVKTLRGRIVGMMMIRYLDYFLYPQRYNYQGELIFYANYVFIQQHLFTVVGKLKHLGHIDKSRYFKFRIKTESLYKLSNLFYEALQAIVQKEMLSHYKRLLSA